MTIRRPLWASQRVGGGGGDDAGEVVITEDQQVPSIEVSLGYVGEDDDPVVTLDITDPASDAEELRVYRSTSPISSDSLPAPMATLSASTTSEDDDAVSLDTTYYYRIASVTGGLVRLSGEQSVEVVENAGDDFSTAEIGDEIGGGIYAGTDTIDGTDYHIVAGLAESEEHGLQWKTSRTATTGTGSDTDGLANTLAMETAGLADHPAAAHCLAYDGGGYNDWHMPARSQLTLMYNNLRDHAEFADNVSSGDYTWSSTESSSNAAWNLRFSDGSEGSGFKDITNRRVRPIRRVAV